jgi:lipopolysaccharide transport system ATP-binding protein
MSTVIKVENLSKQYRLGLVGASTFKEDYLRWWSRIRGKSDPFLQLGVENERTLYSEEKFVWSLKDIFFEVKKGEVLGVIGNNGAGKSTLLKILSKITSPTTGSVKIKGRIASLLEVGTGFHPELTGRENIYLNGTILGMTKKEITSKIDEIIKYAGIEKYADTPVKRYSSGMYVRLAFSVAAFLDTDILIIDEVLAVGDAEFQTKCLGKMREISSSGRTVLFVSHNMGSVVNLCTKAIYLDKGQLIAFGKPKDMVDLYLKKNYFSDTKITFPHLLNKKGQFLTAKLSNRNGEETTSFVYGDSPILELVYILNESVKNFHVAVILNDSLGNHIYSTADTDLRPELLSDRSIGKYKCNLNLPVLNLNVGTYHISIGMGLINLESFHREDIFSFNIVDSGFFGTNKEGDRRSGLLIVENKWDYEN